MDQGMLNTLIYVILALVLIFVLLRVAGVAL